jgi:hypothetical protein
VRETCDKDDRDNVNFNLSNGYQSYTITPCRKNNFGTERFGVPPSELPIFDNRHICIKRDSSLTYHSIVKMRTDEIGCKNKNKCGPQINQEKTIA